MAKRRTSSILTGHLPHRVYSRIHQLMPIACVDVALFNGMSVLLVRRKIEPLKGQMFFPGGRVLRGETMMQAAIRKLNEEVGTPAQIRGITGTTELITDTDPFGHGQGTHSISTLFVAETDEWDFYLNGEHSDAHWDTLEEILKWSSPVADEYLRCCVNLLKNHGF